MILKISIVISIVISSFLAAASGQIIVWSDEAENAILSGTVEIKEDCSHASGTRFVKPGNDINNSLLFNNINIETAGTYQLKIFYFSAAETALEILVNGNSTGFVYIPAANWCYQDYPHEYLVEIELSEGINSLEFKPVSAEISPFLDRFEIWPIYPQREGPETFYLSSSEGNDNNDGLTEQSPWKSLEMISWVTLIPGDSILFNSGDTFTGQLKVNGSGNSENHVVIGKYGEGNLPVIDGANAEGGAYFFAILINNHDHIEISELKVVNDRKISRIGVQDKEGYGIYVLNSGDSVMQNFHFRNLVVSDVYAVNSDGLSHNELKMTGIAFFSNRNKVAGKEKNIQDVLVENCYFTHIGKVGVTSGHGGGETGIGNDSVNRNMNFVIRNNHFFENGGSGVVLARTYNGLLEHNIFEYPGSDVDPRMAKRGSGAWFWNSQNIIAQYNKSLHVRGEGDSYSMHIDFANRNVILQYNYSEDAEGGFVEILGNNINSVYRFNVSVNDGFRDNGKTIWVSDYAGINNNILSDSNYIYNNSIYVNGNITPDISVKSKSTFIYNNIFCAAENAVIGESVSLNFTGGPLLSNNLYYGDVRTSFSDWDAAPVFGDPRYINPGEIDTAGYKLNIGSFALNAGVIFPEPVFPMAGKGIFKDIPPFPDKDLYGNPVSVGSIVPHIGAYNGEPLDVLAVGKIHGGLDWEVNINTDILANTLNISVKSYGSEKLNISMFDISGRIVFSTQEHIMQGLNKLEYGIGNFENGIYIISVNNGELYTSRKILIFK